MRRLFPVLFLVFFILGAAGQETPQPTLQEIEIYDVEGLSASDRETGGYLVTSGINQTFSINHSERYHEYRFEFIIENEGDGEWNLDDGDVMEHENLDPGWGIDESGDVWYNTTSERYFGGAFQDGDIEWDTSPGGTVGTGETLFAKYVVNISTEAEDLRDQYFLVNTTDDEYEGSEDYHELDVKRFGALYPVLVEPPNDTKVQKNRFFEMMAEVTCLEGVCGEVDTSIRYNETGDADTLVQENSAEPFYTNASNTATCSADLGLDETCSERFFVNATGETESYHLLDTNASSSYSDIDNNSSDDNQVQINEVLMVDAQFDAVEFGLLDPGTENSSATGNEDLAYNISIPEESNTVDNLWIRATEMESQEREDYNIQPGNASYSTENDVDTSERLSSSYQLLANNLVPGSVLTTFYWLDVPYGIYQGGYNGTLYFKVNSTG